MTSTANVDINEVKKAIIANIDPHKSPKSIKLVVAMSGGVDSSTIAAILKSSGYDVIGITMLLYRHNEQTNEDKTCCGITDVKDARRIAHMFGFPHYSLNCEEQFKKYVIDYFITQYTKGKTPIPCLMCNQEIKFKYLIKTLEKLDADYLVTGHYANLKIENNKPILSKGVDQAKDQTYFLFSSPKESLLKTRFPLGMFTKYEVRQIAKKLGLQIHSKKESQDICFIRNNYKDFLSKNNVKNKEGNFINLKGEIIGKHSGIHNFTVGQRRGINIIQKTSNEPMYVLKIQHQTNEVVVGHKSQLKGKTIFIINLVEFINLSSFIGAKTNNLKAKIRSTQEEESIKILATNSSKCMAEFENHSTSITNGQACVIYSGATVVGGGIICSKEDYEIF